MFPNAMWRGLVAIGCATALFFAASCSQSDVIISLEAVADSLVSGGAVLGVLSASGRINQGEASQVGGILSQAGDATGQAVNILKGGGIVDADKILQVANLLGGILTVVGVASGWGPLVEPIILGVTSAIRLVLEQLHAPPGPARARVFGSPHQVKFALTHGDRQALSRITLKLVKARAEVVSASH